MISDHHKRDNNEDNDTTFSLTVTSTYTLESMPTNEQQLSSEIGKSQSGSVSFTLTTEMASTTGSNSGGAISTSSSADSSSQQEAKSPSGVLGASSSKDNSLVVGLAIGIPIAVIAVVVGIILLWYYLKRQKFEKRRKLMFPYRNGKFFDEKQLPPKENINKEDNWSSNTIGQKNDEESRTYPRREANQQGHSVRNFFNRLSRSVNLFSLNDVDDPSQANNRQNINSPFYLKQFHLNNNASDSLDSEENFAGDNGTPPREEINHGNTTKKTRCPKLPPLVEAYTSN